MNHLLASDDQKYWNFSFSISPSSEYSALIFLKIDWEPEKDGLKEDGPEELALRNEKGQRRGVKTVATIMPTAEPLAPHS